MNDGSLPKAVIHPDVTKLMAKDVGLVDFIVGGWPCQDLSPMGLRLGMKKGTRSGLISEVYRLTDSLKPKALFLENVPEVLNNGMRKMIMSFVKDRGYEMRWVVVPASAVGAPHVRKRFFCLVCKSNWRPTFSRLKYDQMSWNREPARMIVDGVSNRIRRVEMMGNSVVPDCVRAAFITLAEGFDKVPGRKLIKETTSISVKNVNPDLLEPHSIQNKLPKWGMARLDASGKVSVFAVKDVPRMRVPNLELCIDPSKFRRNRSRTANTRGFISARVRKPEHLSSWSTPRLISGASNILTERTLRDLPTQVRFEAETPDDVRKGYINPTFVEWVMGYKRNWTKTAMSKKQ